MEQKIELSEVTEGVDVYDSDGARVGVVEAVRLGEGAEKASATDILTMAGWVSEALGRTHDLPPCLLAGFTPMVLFV